MLDRELQLVTAAELDGSTPGPDRRPDPACGGGRQTPYQLAHDYLVRPIRQWLEREQGSTRKGRAGSGSGLITASWLERPGPRQLPSLLEWAGILLHIPPCEWSADERRLMRAANRHYLTRGRGVPRPCWPCWPSGARQSRRPGGRGRALLGAGYPRPITGTCRR